MTTDSLNYLIIFPSAITEGDVTGSDGVRGRGLGARYQGQLVGADKRRRDALMMLHF